MAGESRIDILIAARDQAAGAINSVKGELGSIAPSANEASGALEGLAAAGAVVGALELGKQAFELAQMGAQAERTGNSFRQMQAAAGQSAAGTLAALHKASQGAIADSQLELDANRAKILGVADSSEKLTQLLEVASARGKAVGESTAAAFSDIVTGIGRMSPLILDNLGIVTGGTATFDAYAASIGKTAAQLSDAEKKQALFNKVVEDSKGMVAANISAGADAATSFERLSASLTNAKESLGKFLLLGGLVPKFLDDFSKDLQSNAIFLDLVSRGATNAAQAVGLVGPATSAASSATGELSGSMMRSEGAADAAADAQQRYALHAKVAAQANYEENASVITLAGSLPGLTAELNRAAGALAGARAASVARLAGAAAGVEDIVGTAQAQQLYNAALEETDTKIAAVNADFAAGKITQDEFQLKLAEIGQTGGGAFDAIHKAQQEAESSAKKYASTVESTIKQAYDHLKSDVGSVIQGALGDIGGVNIDDLLVDQKEKDPKKQVKLLPRDDVISEDARRLADVAVKGFDSPWANYFKEKFPALWAQNFAGAGGDNTSLRRQAAQLLKNFQDGLEPELLDKEKAKERVRRMILGEQATTELVKEITDELNGEFGKAAPADLKSLVQQSLTGGAGQAGPGAAFQGANVLSGASTGGADAAAAFSGAVVGSITGTGNKAIAAIETELRADANLAKLGVAGAMGGTRYGSDFLTNAINNISKPFIDAVSAIVTGNVIAYQAQQAQQTGATP